MSSPSKLVFRFGPFVLDARRRTLTRAGAALAVTPKALELLLFLVERRDTVVEKDAILQGLWPNTVVEEGNITVTMSALRRVLGESRADHRYIVTIPGRGYQFVAEVETAGDEGVDETVGSPAAVPTEPPAVTPEPPRPIAARHEVRAAAWVLAAAAAVAIVVSAAPYGTTSGVGADRSETADIDARSLFLQGQFFLDKRTADGLYRALDYFEQATRRSPEFAGAYTGIADAYNMLGYFGFLPAREAFPLAEAAARTALRIDPDLAAAHTSLAYIQHRYYWNWEAAEAGFKRAIALDPEYSAARHWYAAFLESMGRDREAVAEGRQALTLDPVALVIGANLGSMLGASSRVDEAVEQCRRLLEMDRTFWPAHWALAQAFVVRRNLDQADVEFAAAAELSGRMPYVLAHLAEHYAESGRPRDAAAVLDELERLGTRQHVPAYYRAMIQAALGQTDRAFESLERAVEERSASLPFLKIKHRLKPLRHDPRFQHVLRRVGLPD